jgi:hypothetical protein
MSYDAPKGARFCHQTMTSAPSEPDSCEKPADRVTQTQTVHCPPSWSGFRRPRSDIDNHFQLGHTAKRPAAKYLSNPRKLPPL